MPLVRKIPNAKRAAFQFGYSVGAVQSGKTYVNNHLKFTVLFNEPSAGRKTGPFSSVGELETSDTAGFRVVGFEVEPFSVAHTAHDEASLRSQKKTCPITDNLRPQELLPNVPITFTYDVSFVMSSTRWATRWDPLLASDPDLKHIQWFSVVNSLFVTCKLQSLEPMSRLAVLGLDGNATCVETCSDLSSS
jgi:transmembrane 9 superfamily member 2/4